MISEAPPTRPVLRYHGGKFRIREWAIAHFPDHKVYIEPFGGAASVLLAKKPVGIEVYNDIDQGVVNLFRVLRDPVQSAHLISDLELTPFSRQEYWNCAELADDPVEEARRMIVCSFQSIGAKQRGERNGWRTRTAKTKWSPCAAWNSYPPALAAVVDRLREGFEGLGETADLHFVHADGVADGLDAHAHDVEAG